MLSVGHVKQDAVIDQNQITALDWIEQCFTSPPTQYRLYGRRFLQVKRPNQQYQSTEGTYTVVHRQIKHTKSRHEHKTQQVP